MTFAYLRDPLFVACLCLYALNRYAFEPLTDVPFFHNHFNDLICIPFLVPILLTAARATGLRRHDARPLTHEVIIPLITWSILFEIVFPRHPFWSPWLTADPNDILWYSIGAAVALTYWPRRYRPAAPGAADEYEQISAPVRRAPESPLAPRESALSRSERRL